MSVSNQQIQTYVDNRVRPSATDIVTWVLRRQSDMANISDIYANLTNSPTWADENKANAIHTAQPSDVLAWNTFVSQLLDIITGSATDANATLAKVQALQGQWPIIKQLPTFQVP